MYSAVRPAVEQFIAHENLPSNYADTVEQWFLPLAHTVLQKLAHSRKTLVVGISGSQGSGKTTLASLLVVLLKELMGVRALNLSIDDFYLTHAERQHLARTVHPLLATRGVPGTHDVALAVQTLQALASAGTVAIPRFTKAIDDRAPPHEWPQVQGPVDVIVLEGWCLSIPAQNAAELITPINELERQDDVNGDWRRYVNAALQQHYGQWYGLVDFLVMLKAPRFEKVYEWRQNQEDKLRAAVEMGSANGSRLMNHEQLRRFIQHYERLTRHGLQVLPALADVVYELTDQQTIAGRVKG
jgi:D-glycerate 3-kinase